MIRVELPDSLRPERLYITRLVFEEFWGLDIDITFHREPSYRIVLRDDRVVTLPDVFFATAQHNWLRPESLPRQPLKRWNVSKLGLECPLSSREVPVIFGNDSYDGPLIVRTETGIELGLDVLGSAFFMLTRYEECVKDARDSHDRFPASASLAYQEGFLDRPIINEYLELLWTCIHELAPRLARRPREFRQLLSHDVDFPFRYLHMTRGRIARHAIAAGIRARSLNASIDAWRKWKRVVRGDLAIDPFNTFDMIMDVSETHGLASAFYFITDHSAGPVDGEYDIDSPAIRELLRAIYQRGHEIGLHCSYNTYLDPVQTRREFERLLQVCEREGIRQREWGGRQHYLRWRTPVTFRNWDDAGLDYDSTLGFADCAGFRCGICYEYPAFDVIDRRPLSLRERPLVVMECTVIDERYMGLGASDAAFHVMKRLKDECRRYRGDFTLLWHNSRFVDKSELALYKEVVAC